MFDFRHTLPIALVLLALCYTVTSQATPDRKFTTLKRSDLLRSKALLRWLINNRTENGTTTFNAGFIRLAFHDCVGGCDGCLNLQNPSNAGLAFYKLPLDLMYLEFISPLMSRADWYALAGLTAVEYAAERTPCTGNICIPPMTFKWGRRDCADENRLFRRFPGPDNDPRDTIRRTFRMNLLEITALMGAHTLGKNHGTGATWVDNEVKFDNQYFKDMLNSSLQWRKGVRQGAAVNTWSHGQTGKNIMLTSDFFMAFDVGTGFAQCTNNPIENCQRSETFNTVERFAEDNDYWLSRFGTAFTVMLNNGNFGKLKDVEWDTENDTFTGDIFFPRIEISTSSTTAATTTADTTTDATTTAATTNATAERPAEVATTNVTDSNTANSAASNVTQNGPADHPPAVSPTADNATTNSPTKADNSTFLRRSVNSTVQLTKETIPVGGAPPLVNAGFNATFGRVNSITPSNASATFTTAANTSAANTSAANTSAASTSAANTSAANTSAASTSAANTSAANMPAVLSNTTVTSTTAEVLAIRVTGPPEVTSSGSGANNSMPIEAAAVVNRTATAVFTTTPSASVIENSEAGDPRVGYKPFNEFTGRMRSEIRRRLMKARQSGRWRSRRVGSASDSSSSSE